MTLGMGYQALLFCPEEKTARTVTQVLSELEFSVDPCTEPFAAVKKLMGEHFDAIVVDCDNEQNATLLFKSARNSTSNQASLAVAVVEGQAGVAKAFRIGANLVLTKPINVEQAKGTLRVARGLLRKGDPAKAGTPAPATQSSAPVMPSATMPQTPARRSVTSPRSDVANQPAKTFSSQGPVLTTPATAMAVRPVAPTNDEDDVIDIDAPAAPATLARNAAAASSTFKTGSPSSKPVVPSAPAASSPAIKPAKETVSPPSAVFTGSASGAGTGSAAAPARSPQKFGAEKATPPEVANRAEALFEKSTDLGKAESSAPSTNVPAPAFSFGGANAPAEPSLGGSKKALIGVAAAALVAAGLYVGWTQLHGKTSSTEQSPKIAATGPAITVTPASTATAPVNTATSKIPPAIAPSKSAIEMPALSSSAPEQPTSQPTPQKLTDTPAADKSQHPSDKTAAAKSSTKAFGSTSTTPAKSSSDAEPTVQPIVVRQGTALPVHAPSPALDAPAPSVLDIAPSASGGSLSNLLSNTNDTSKPVLQTVNVSQGVSQGLLIKKVQPIYPPTAIRMHFEGSVQLLATIGKTGNITGVKVLSGETILAQAAMDAVKQWKYKPYYLNGDPVEIQTQVTVFFKLPR